MSDNVSLPPIDFRPKPDLSQDIEQEVLTINFKKKN